MKKLLIIFLAALAFGCNNDDDNKGNVYCTEEAMPPLIVTVTDAESGTVLTDGVTVLAVSGAVSIAVPYNGHEAFAGGVPANTYKVTVMKEGYATYTSADQTQQFGQCGPVTNNMSVLLEPLLD